MWLYIIFCICAAEVWGNIEDISSLHFVLIYLGIYFQVCSCFYSSFSCCYYYSCSSSIMLSSYCTLYLPFFPAIYCVHLSNCDVFHNMYMIVVHASLMFIDKDNIHSIQLPCTYSTTTNHTKGMQSCNKNS